MATQKQIDYLLAIGVEIPDDMTIREASELIERAKARLADERVQIKTRYNLIKFAGRYTDLKRKTSREHTGPCPSSTCRSDPNNEDRFNVQSDKFLCRVCHPKWGDIVSFVAWYEDCSQLEAMGRLRDNTLNLPIRKQPPAERPRPQRDYRGLAVKSLRVLASAAGNPGRAYLTGRGIDESTWLAWGIGLIECHRWSDDEYTKLGWGVAMPWVSGDKVTGVNCRLLAHEQRYHRFGNVSGLFGGHKLTGSDTLIFCEGEINALSIWQALGGRIDVLSFGSESVTKSAQFSEVAKPYAHVIIWCDREPVVQTAMLRCPGAAGIKSPRGMDANDLLQAGILAEFLYNFVQVQKPVPQRHAPDGYRERRYSELLQREFLLAEEARELRNLAQQLGRPLDFKRIALGGVDK